MTTSKIRIAYILTPITFGGAEKVSLNFLRTIDRGRFDIFPVLLSRPWEEESYFAKQISLLGYSYNTVPVAIKKKSDYMRVPRVAQRLHSFLQKGEFDIVHTNGHFADICGQSMARILNIKGISTCHGFIASDLKFRVYILLDKIFLRLCSQVVAVSEEIKAELVRSGINESRIVVLQNGVAIPSEELEFSRREKKRSSLNLLQDDFVIGYLGRLSKEKGLTYLFDAVQSLSEGERRVKLLIVGDGPERSILERRARATGVAERFVFTGFQADIENWYPAFDIFALPSITEGTPLALLEAMAAGVPVIASAVGGVPKIVTDGVDGLLVPPGNSSAIKERLQMVMADTELSCRLGKAGRKTVAAGFGIDWWCRAIESCYRGVLRKSSAECVLSEIP